MILDTKELKLFDKKFAEYIKIKPPFRIHTSMPNEACFIYMHSGQLKVRTPFSEFGYHTQPIQVGPISTGIGLNSKAGFYFEPYSLYRKIVQTGERDEGIKYFSGTCSY